VSDLEDAIREHLELKRRRGADPAALAREEHEALAPVTRSHPIVVAPRVYVEAEVPDAHEFAATAASTRAEIAGHVEDALDDDATQEFRVEHDGDWLAAGD
jgi:hypothetical protein